MARAGILLEFKQKLQGLKATRAEATKTAKAVGGIQKAMAAAGVAVGAGVLVQQMRQAAQASIFQAQQTAQLEAVLRSTGNAVGLTVSELQAMASEQQRLNNIGDETIQQMQGVLLTFKRIGGETFPDATQAIIDLSIRMGTDLKSAAIQVGKALDDPARGLDALTRSGVVFSDVQKEMIRGHFAAGEAAKGQAIILEELNSQIGGSGASARNAAGGGIKAMSLALGDLSEVVGDYLVPALDSFGNALERTVTSEGFKKTLTFLLDVGTKATILGLFKNAGEAAEKHIQVQAAGAVAALDAEFQKAIDTAFDEELQRQADAAAELAQRLEDSAAAAFAYWEQIQRVRDVLKEMASVSAEPLAIAGPSGPMELIDVPAETERLEIVTGTATLTWFDQLKSMWEELGQFISAVLERAMMQASDALVDAIQNRDASNLESAFADIGQEMGAQMGTAIGASLGGPVGAAIGNILGQLIGAEVGKVVGEVVSSILGMLGLTKDPRRIMGSFAVGPGGANTDMMGQFFSGRGGTPEAQSVANQMLEQIEDIFRGIQDAINGTLDLSRNMAVQIRRDGSAILQIIDTATGRVLWEQVFGTVQEAMEAGLEELLATAMVNVQGPLAEAFRETIAQAAVLGLEGMMEQLQRLASIGQTLDQMLNPVDSVLAQLAAMRAELEAMTLSTEALTAALDAIAEAEARRMKEIGDNALAQLAAHANELGIQTQFARRVGRDLIRIQFAKIKADLIQADIWLKYRSIWRDLRREALAATRSLEDAGDQLARIGSFDYSGGSSLADLARDVQTITDLTTVPDTGGGDGSTWWANQVATMQAFADQMRQVGRSSSPFQRLQDQWTEFVETFGRFADRAVFKKARNEFLAAWARMLEDAKDSLAAWGRDLFQQFGQGTPRELLSMTQSDVLAAFNAAMADPAAFGDFQSIAQAFLQQAADLYGTSTSDFAQLFDWIQNLTGQLGDAEFSPVVSEVNAQTTALLGSQGLGGTNQRLDLVANRIARLERALLRRPAGATV